MRLRLIVKNSALLCRLWRWWACEQKYTDEEILQNNGSLANEPIVGENMSEHKLYYDTHSGKGNYEFFSRQNLLKFIGYRNSFGKAKFFRIERINNNLILISKIENTEYKISLTIERFATSKPEQPFWAVELPIAGRGCLFENC